MKVYGRCPFCSRRILLRARKDFESHSGIEMLRHYRKEHPEKLNGTFGMPYFERDIVELTCLRDREAPPRRR